METTTETVITKEAINIISFLQQCNQFRKLPNQKVHKYILHWFDGKHFKHHLCSKWNGYKKDFGAFYLNLSYDSQITIYNFFGLNHPDDIRYLEERTNAEESESPSILFIKSPVLGKKLNVLHVFFNNHGISENCTEYLKLNNVPKFNGNSFDEKDKSYGNSNNWMDYLLKLPFEEQKRIINTILENYKG